METYFQLRLCDCGHSEVSIEPFGRRSHAVVCRACGSRGCPSLNPLGALALWNDGSFPPGIKTLEKFPPGVTVSISVIFEGQYKVGYKKGPRLYLPGSGSYYGLDEALARAYADLVDTGLT